jgi:hypothetical protein
MLEAFEEPFGRSTIGGVISIEQVANPRSPALVEASMLALFAFFV